MPDVAQARLVGERGDERIESVAVGWIAEVVEAGFGRELLDVARSMSMIEFTGDQLRATPRAASTAASPYIRREKSLQIGHRLHAHSPVDADHLACDPRAGRLREVHDEPPDVVGGSAALEGARLKQSIDSSSVKACSGDPVVGA